jgi:ABC-type multidrug transport system ATPase subunit
MTGFTLENLSLAYKNGNRSTEICNSVNLSFAPGQITGILGPNGCGKSTLVRAIIGLIAPVSGAIKFDGLESTVGYIPQDFKSSFFTWASLKSNIRLTLPRSFSNWKQSGSKIEDVKKDFGIALDLNLKPQKCSGGMLQQAAIIRAFASNPKLIVADEPFSALDVTIASKVRRRFRDKVVNQGIAGIIISHNLDDLLSTCDKVILIPNKPYTSTERAGHYQVKVLNNEHLSEYISNGDSSSLEKIALNLFANGKNY